MIDVASSQPKKHFEASIIAEACLNMLSYLFYDAKSHLTIRKPSKFDKYSVYIWDTDLIKRKLAEKDGFQIFNQLNNKDEFNYIIGCAGRCSLPISSLYLLCNNFYLISVSSAAIEFPFHDMIQYALSKTSNKNLEICLPNDELNHLDDENIHRNIC
ncbi:unnamed protein product [Rotaria sp. Silwood2]|nr:unnamed protein product [Rotaria sp. Silwood2]